MSPDTLVRAEPVTPTLSREDPEPQILQRPTPRPRSRAAPAANRPPGYLSINSSPWAELSVDGHVVGNTPQVRIRVTPGRHRLLLVRKGFQTHSAWVTVAAGGTLRLTDITLESVAQ
ncbi:MAG TPA: PEGA domain-containing protein [Methylomirabilota bacterium]|nr:PEGA domain-containing protein [Methylomirabilota bacterium]